MPSQSGKRVIFTFAVFSALKSAPGRGHSLEPQRWRPRDGGGGRREAGGSRAAPRRARGYSARPRGRSSIRLPRPPRPFDRASSSRRRHQLQRARPGLAWLRRAGSPACSQSRGQAFRRVLGGQVHPPAPPRGRAHLRRRPGSEWRRKVCQPPAPHPTPHPTPHPAPHPAPCARSRSRHPGPVQVRGDLGDAHPRDEPAREGTSCPREAATVPATVEQDSYVSLPVNERRYPEGFFPEGFRRLHVLEEWLRVLPACRPGGRGAGAALPGQRLTRAASHRGGVWPRRRLTRAGSRLPDASVAGAEGAAGSHVGERFC